MSVYRLTVHSGAQTLTLYADGENSILKSLGSQNISVGAPCGGRGVCGKCGVELKGLVRSLEGGEVFRADGRLLACRYAPAGELELWLAEENGLRIAQSGTERIDGGGEGLGLAVDVGTTTVAAALYELSSGERVSEKSVLNAQRGFGADVVSRMEHCRKGGLDALRDVTARQLSALTDDRDALRRVVIVGNAVMQHLAAGLDPSSMAVPPFTAESLFGEVRSSDIWQNAEVYYAPCVSAYVGGDITAGMLACGMQSAEGLWLYVDIGTNGEIAIGNKNGWLTCATAAGPCFEGAEIDCGMNAAEGAIDRVRAENGGISAHVIGEGKAKGICGSGIIDAVAALLELGLISRSGRFIPAEKADEKLRERFTVKNGVRVFMLCEEVYITQQDIRRVQLAKAAIRGGIETLLDGRTPDGLVVAGGFGRYIDLNSAVRIGLLPELPEERIRQAGNAAARGAALLLSDEARERVSALRDICEYIDLSSSKKFSDSYISYLNF